MKVLFVINSLATGGAEKIILDLIPSLTENGVVVKLLLLDDSPTPFLETLKKQNVCQIVGIGSGRVYNPLLVFRMARHFKGIDLVHVHLFPSLYWAALAKVVSWSRIPMVFTEHSTFNRRRKKWLFRITDLFMYRKYSCIVAISTEVKLYLKKHLKHGAVKFKTIQNGVHLDLFRNAIPLDRSLFVTKTKDKIIVMIARFSAEKDHETLLKAVPFFHKAVTVLLVGDGPRLSKMKELTQLLEIEDRVRFLGTREDVPNILKMADIAVLSSNHEGLSLSGIEAMASGTPLVASKVSGLVSLVHGGGVFFEHRDYLDLAKKINRLLDDPKWYEQKSAACLKRSEKYGLDQMVQEHLKLYQEQC